MCTIKNKISFSKMYIIVNIAEHQQYIDEVAKISFNEWPEECKDCDINSIEEYAEDIREEYLETGWPLVLVAIDKDKNVAGAAALDPNDMSDRPKLQPWVASLLVLPEHRGKGVGSLLIDAVIFSAKQCKLKNVYLWAKDDVCSIYSRRGFRTIEHRSDYCGHPVNIMERDLSTASTQREITRRLIY